MGGHHRHPDIDRRHLRHELRADPVRPGVGIRDRDRAHGRERDRPLHVLQAPRVALSTQQARGIIATLLRIQAQWCERLGSPLYASLFTRAADDAEAGGPVFEVLEGREGDELGSALALRFGGAVHRLVLEAKAPELAAFYPSAGGRAEGDAWPAFRAPVEANAGELR